jgi:hypothetical protein
MTPPGRVVRGIRRAFRANPGRELTTRDRRLAVQQQASTDTALNTTAANWCLASSLACPDFREKTSIRQQ